MSVELEGFGISGFRSFGEKRQVIGPLGRFNVFIGKNNMGKSNILRFVELLVKVSRGGKGLDLDFHDFNQDTKGIAFGLTLSRRRIDLKRGQNSEQKFARQVLDAWPHKIDDKLIIWQEIKGGEVLSGVSQSYANHLSEEVGTPGAWRCLSNCVTGGFHEYDSDKGKNVRNVLEALSRVLPESDETRTLSALREIGFESARESKDGEWSFRGRGVVDRLFKAQNWKAHEYDLKHEYERVQAFIKDLLEDETAHIRVSHDKQEITVFWGDRELPLKALGTGIHQMVLMAVTCTLFHDKILLIEEPELHLHPDLQRKLISHLYHKTDNQYLITTHSAEVIDFPEATVFHVWYDKKEKSSLVRRVETNAVRAEVAAELGYRASDIVQSNVVVWVEGPSDRIYVEHWLKRRHGLEEDRDYQIMFYGGGLVAHITGLDKDEVGPEEEELISLLTMNRNSVVMIDQDRESGMVKLKPAVIRLMKALVKPGSFWLTGGREVENYVPLDILWEAKKKVHSRSKLPKKPRTRYHQVTTYLGRDGKVKEMDKVKVARTLVEWANEDRFEWDWKRLRLGQSLDEVASFIREANKDPIVVSASSSGEA